MTTFMDMFQIDISETNLRESNPKVLAGLLRCHSSWRHAGSPKGREADFNIIWATTDYEYLGEGYGFHDRITADLITGDERGNIIRPRVLKSREEQYRRVKEKAEVFTPSWVCNEQNNLIDEAWFGRKDVFNIQDTEKHTWIPTEGKISFPACKDWMDYVCATRLEMCCGEAPYLVSRYDAVTGEIIPVERRIGLLDRKLRVVSENTDNIKDWHRAVRNALKATYGFEWQGDSLLLAREAVLYTIYDYFEAKFHNEFPEEEKVYLAYIISWNIFQMDGLKLVVPDTCHPIKSTPSMFDEFPAEEAIPCPGCKAGTRNGHNGIPALLAEWDFDRALSARKSKPRKVAPFSQSLINK